jgi:hypothetical protein
LIYRPRPLNTKPDPISSPPKPLAVEEEQK